MATWIYNNDILREHPIYGCCSSYIYDVSNRDYPNKKYFERVRDMECLDMDQYEKNINKSPNPDCTTDAVIGICNYDNQQARNPRLLCVELRMDYQSIRTFSKTDFERKVVHTKGLLGQNITVEKTSLFVFSDKLEAQAVRWFDRIGKEGGILKNVKPCGVSDFFTIIMSEKDFPYKPKNNEEEIRKNFEVLYNNQKWIEFMEDFSKLCYKSYDYYGKSNKEFEFLKGLIIEIWSDFRLKKPVFDNENIEIYALNIESEIQNILKLNT